ncbi:GntR family transcriptional regulator [Microbacterium sp. Marseille-Q6965]|uniref:GntR family transcriptional regulator n=1 Tax=Microbacterium sp. Marseille-Q6965 TaxID=2965072 RepID=UPI0021B72AF0|nr:GntR family transcriptional regulator [Microbacterium sp. Marseille-Q6965]
MGHAPRTRQGGIPLYRRIATELWERIQNGTLRPGDRMPSEPELATEFEVNRLTVRQAIVELQRLGAVEIRRGTGTFVAAPPDLVEIIARIPAPAPDDDATHAALAGHSDGVVETLLPTRPLLRVEERIEAVTEASGRYGELAARELGVPLADLFRLDTVMVRSGQAWIVNSYWFPRRLEGVVEALGEHGMVIATLRDGLGLDLSYRWRAFSAVAADYHEARLLDVPTGTALLVRDGVTADAAGAPVFYVRRRLRGDNAKFVLRYGA